MEPVVWDMTGADYAKWTMAALADELEQRGESKSGKKQELVERLEALEPRQGKKRERSENEENLLNDLECPVCLSPTMPPFEQCRNGHIICGDCKPSLEGKCSLCRVSISSGLGRNLMMEKVVSTLMVECPHGCGAEVPYDSRAHSETCLFAPIACSYVHKIKAVHGAPKPTLKCGFKGSADALSAHMLEAHGKEGVGFMKTTLDTFQWTATSRTWNGTTRLQSELFWTRCLVDLHDEDLKMALKISVVPDVGFVFLPCLLHRAYEGTYEISITQQESERTFHSAGKLIKPGQLRAGMPESASFVSKYVVFPLQAGQCGKTTGTNGRTTFDVHLRILTAKK